MERETREYPNLLTFVVQVATDETTEPFSITEEQVMDALTDELEGTGQGEPCMVKLVGRNEMLALLEQPEEELEGPPDANGATSEATRSELAEEIEELETPDEL